MMTLAPSNPLVLLIADDDEDDRLLIQEALGEAGFEVEMTFCTNGEELLTHLTTLTESPHLTSSMLPDLVLLDLNMPLKGGMDVIRELRAQDDFRTLPIIVLTTSKDVHDAAASYALGANSFMSKPHSYDRLVEMMSSIKKYWSTLATRPGQGEPEASEEA